MKVLSDILFKGEVAVDELPSVNGGSVDSVVIDSNGKLRKASLSGSVGAIHNVNTSDGSGGFQENLLAIESKNLRPLKTATKAVDNNSGISFVGSVMVDSHDIISHAPKIEIHSDEPLVKSGSGGAFQPSKDDHIVNKKYVDDQVSEIIIPEEKWEEAYFTTVGGINRALINVPLENSGAEYYVDSELVFKINLAEHPNIRLSAHKKLSLAVFYTTNLVPYHAPLHIYSEAGVLLDTTDLPGSVEHLNPEDISINTVTGKDLRLQVVNNTGYGIKCFFKLKVKNIRNL